MTIVKWNPQRSVFNDIDSWFDMAMPSSLRANRHNNWNPSFDISENNIEYKITVDLPGMNKNDLTIDISDDSLLISGERQREESDRISYDYEKNRYGEFKKSFSLSDNCIQDKISANMKNGVLEIYIPKTKELVKTSRKIKIK